MGENPMNNEVILRNLFALCPSELLANCRLVCTTWHQLSLRSWRELTCPRLCYDRDALPRYYWDSDFSSTPIAWEGDTDDEDEGDDENSSSASVSDNEEAESTDEEQSSQDEDADSDAVDSDHDDSSSEAEEDTEDEEDQVPAELGVRNSIQEYFTFLEDPSSQYGRTPHRRFVLNHWKFNDQRLGRLWTLVGNKITRLFLNRCQFPGAEEFRQVVFNSCPNLEVLVLYFCSFDVIEPKNLEEGTQYQEPAYGQNRHLRKLTIHTGWFPISWLELLSHFQDLSELKLYVWFEEESANTIEIQKAVQAISVIRNHDPSKLPLTSFDFGGLLVSSESREVIPLLQKLHIPFDSLDIQLEPGVHSDVVKAALEPCMKNLSMLRIEKSSGPSFPFGMAPQIWDNLRTLELTGDTCDNLEFMRFTPNLKDLIIVDHTIVPQYREIQIVANTSRELIGDVKFPKLTGFYMYFVVSEDDLRCLTRWFPNVDNCSLVMDDGLFAIVCESWKKLRHLTVHGDALTDEGITGRSMLPSEADPTVESEENVPPNITCLQDLEVAQLRGLKLTDHSVTHGFLRLPKLRHLEFYRGSDKFGEQVMKALEERGVQIDYT